VLFFASRFFVLRARERESAKKARALTYDKYIFLPEE
jgi:hypothetical protein